jgi:hypothetical protein
VLEDFELDTNDELLELDDNEAVELVFAFEQADKIPKLRVVIRSKDSSKDSRVVFLFIDFLLSVVKAKHQFFKVIISLIYITYL